MVLGVVNPPLCTAETESPRKDRQGYEVVLGCLGAGELLALDAIAGRPQLPEPTGVEQPHVDLALKSADLFLSYIFERIPSELVAARRAGLLILLIAFTVCACGAYPAFDLCLNNSADRTAGYCGFVTGEWFLSMLSLGLLPLRNLRSVEPL